MLRSVGCALGCAVLLAIGVLLATVFLAASGAAGLYYILPLPLRGPMIAWIEGDVPSGSDVPDRLGAFEQVPFRGYEGPISFACIPVSETHHFVTDCFGTARRGGYIHRGIDFGIVTGSTIVTPWGGQVVWVGWNGPYGVLVVVENQGVQVWFAHNDAALVQVGDIVEAGQPVALSDDSGNSTGPHLHFEIRVKQGEQVWSENPAVFHWPTGEVCNWLVMVPVSSRAPGHCHQGR